VKQLQTLKTVANYAKMNNVTTSYIYKLVSQKKIQFTEIDGVKFVDIAVYPTIKG
jgi:hypothetical protein